VAIQTNAFYKKFVDLYSSYYQFQKKRTGFETIKRKVAKSHQPQFMLRNYGNLFGKLNDSLKKHKISNENSYEGIDEETLCNKKSKIENTDEHFRRLLKDNHAKFKNYRIINH
jgi:hypothetical protein